MPAITGRSFVVSALIARLPTPFRPKTTSTTIAPLRSRPMSIPSIVTIGVIAGRTTCRKITWRRERPFACASRTKFSPEISSMLERMIREYAAA